MQPVDSPVSLLNSLPSVRTVHDIMDVADWHYESHSRAKNTLNTYRSDLKNYRDFLISQKIESFPKQFDQAAVLLKIYFEGLVHLAPSTLNRRKSAISFLYSRLGMPDPTKHIIFQDCFTGIINEKYRPSEELKEPFIAKPAPAFKNIDQVTDYFNAIPNSFSGVRDRAMFLVALFGACRQSEVTSLQFEQIDDFDEYFVLNYTTSKTNNRGKNQYKVIPKSSAKDPLCPYRALKTWLDQSGIKSGPVFAGILKGNRFRKKSISHVTFNTLIKRYAKSANIPNAEEFSGHSFRATFDSWAVMAHVPFQLRRQQTWHENERSENTYPRGIDIKEKHVAFQVQRSIRNP